MDHNSESPFMLLTLNAYDDMIYRCNRDNRPALYVYLCSTISLPLATSRDYKRSFCRSRRRDCERRSGSLTGPAKTKSKRPRSWSTGHRSCKNSWRALLLPLPTTVNLFRLAKQGCTSTDCISSQQCKRKCVNRAVRVGWTSSKDVFIHETESVMLCSAVELRLVKTSITSRSLGGCILPIRLWC